MKLFSAFYIKCMLLKITGRVLKIPGGKLQARREDQEETEISLRRQSAAHLDNPRGLHSSVCLNTTFLCS